ncbi:MAG: hypothetical protein WC879_09285 [Melioribacteraceae bacterium]
MKSLQKNTMCIYNQKVADFLSQKVIAVAGVSRNPKGEVGNLIYK